MRYDALIIGAGPSGLASGIRLAQFGKRVAILEKHYLWGGLNSFYKLNGRLFDSGLHALTNFAPRGAKSTPLGRILRQLRIDWSALELGEQSFSQIAFPGSILRFSNDFALFSSEIARVFPRQVANFERLLAELPTYASLEQASKPSSARRELARIFDDELLIEMLLCPTCFYGGAREGDLDWDQFGILFRSIFLEGLARPKGGIRALLDLFVERFEKEGGELRLKSGVRQIQVENGAARGVVLENGEELEADEILSSAGWVETRRLCGDEIARTIDERESGRLSFFENICVLDRPAHAFGHASTVTFFNDSPRFEYREPKTYTDCSSGVICTPDNFAGAQASGEGLLRVTVLANSRLWSELDRESYVAQKAIESDRALAAAAPHAFDARPHTIFKDTFTPSTVARFTSHENGAIYGSPVKRRDGTTGIEHLHLCGADQGLVGIVGALLSGITMANRHVLTERTSDVG